MTPNHPSNPAQPGKRTALLLAFSALGALPLQAEVAVDSTFTDHMVLQRDTAVPVWGTADPGETVSLEYVPHESSDALPRKMEARAGEDGRWRIDLEPLPASRVGAKVIITGSRSGGAPRELRDVLVGEVWLGSGQSNMAYGTRHFTIYDPDLKKACENGAYPELRVYVDGRWQVADGESVRDFSALLFSFGHALHQELGVPVGLMVGAVNGTPSGSWLTAEMASASPELVGMFKKNSGFQSFEETEADWHAKRELFRTEVTQASKEERRRLRFSHPGTPLGVHYKKKIGPFVPYAIRGVLWDQGESGTKIPGVDQYTVMNALIAGWRKAWNIEDLPFLHIQKPSGGGCAWEQGLVVGKKIPMPWEPLPGEPLPEDRKCTKNLLHIKMGTIPKAHLVTTSDLTPGVHPVHKYSYGQRACRVALGTVYGRKLVTSGPVYHSHLVKDGSIEIRFDHVGSGLAFKHGEKLQGFEIAGDDLKWQWADAVIKNNTVIVRSSKVSQPHHVRYAFNRTFPWANLFNQDGLPTLMFSTSP